MSAAAGMLQRIDGGRLQRTSTEWAPASPGEQQQPSPAAGPPSRPALLPYLYQALHYQVRRLQRSTAPALAAGCRLALAGAHPQAGPAAAAAAGVWRRVLEPHHDVACHRLSRAAWEQGSAGCERRAAVQAGSGKTGATLPSLRSALHCTQPCTCGLLPANSVQPHPPGMFHPHSCWPWRSSRRTAQLAEHAEQPVWPWPTTRLGSSHSW